MQDHASLHHSAFKLVAADSSLHFTLYRVLTTCLGGQSGVAVTRPHGNHQDVGSNPAAARNEKRTLGGPPTEGSPMVQQDLNGIPAM